MFSGCTLQLPDKNKVTGILMNDDALSIDEGLIEGEIQLHTRWYNEDGSQLSTAVVTFYDGDITVASGTTDSVGNLTSLILPSNRELRCVAYDPSGNVLGESKLYIKLSPAFTDFTIIPPHAEGSSLIELNIPSEKINVSAAMFLNSEKGVIMSNLSAYSENLNATAIVNDEDGLDEIDIDEILNGDDSEEAPAETTEETEEAPEEDNAEEDTAE